jgi:RimJ/RimL family protein N-acetyltransferase
MARPIFLRPAAESDRPAIWRILEPTIRAGETYPLPRDMDAEAAFAYWFAPHHTVFVAEDETGPVGSYYLKANSTAGGAHVANCGYMTGPWAWGRGIARAMCLDSFEQARARGFRAMQFNLVISTNEAAVHLWQSCGMEIVGRMPGAFAHPRLGDVDALVLYRRL